jgi:hypothetical protein
MTVKPKDSYNYRLFWRVSWREVASALGYRTAHTAMRAAQRYAKKNELPWPLSSGTEGREIYVARQHGISWLRLMNERGKTADQLQRTAYKYAIRHGKLWPPPRHSKGRG